MNQDKYSQDIRKRLDGLQRIRNDKVDKSNHHYLTLSELNAWLAETAVPFARGSMLDYGCGAKPYEALFRASIDQYTAADVAVAAGAHLDLLIEPGQALPVDDGIFDTVLSTQTLEHVPDPTFYLSEAARVLKPGGRLILTAPMLWRHHEQPYDFQRFTRYGIKNLLLNAGFSIVRIDACGGIVSSLAQAALDALADHGRIYPRINAIINPLIQKLDRKLRDEDLVINWMVVAEKPKIIKSSISSSNLIKIETSCSSCGDKNVFPKSKWNKYFIVSCRKCDCDFIHPMPSSEELKRAYDDPSYFGGGDIIGGYSDYDEQTQPVIPLFKEILSKFERDIKGRKLLDIGCAYGVHLKVASNRGWEAIGVEISDHARAEAIKRLEGKGKFYQSVEDMPSEKVDVVMLLDVIEHYAKPREVFYSLIRKNIIGPETRIIITTPNARSLTALAEGVNWRYYHPPYHLTYFSANTLEIMLKELGFINVTVRGIHPPSDPEKNVSIDLSEGLLAIASGSDIMNFMPERHVPGVSR